jgi:hypothetical protein
MNNKFFLILSTIVNKKIEKDYSNNLFSKLFSNIAKDL